MTARKHSANSIDLKTLVAKDGDLMKALIREALQEVLEAEMTELLGAGPQERQNGRQGYRAGYYERGLVTRIGKLELPVPRDRNGQLQELRWLYDRRDLSEAQRDLAAWLAKWSAKYPKLTNWVEGHIGETLTFYRLPRAHHKHLKSTNMLERLNEEIKRRTRVIRIFPNTESCLRLVRALCVETHEAWLEDNRYLNMELLKEQRRERLREAA